MKNSLGVVLAVFLVLFMVASADADKARLNYDLAVYTYEAGKYNEAEKYISNALKSVPGNPLYNHLMGKICLKAEHYEKSRAYLDKAWGTRDEEAELSITDLQYDLAYLSYKTSDYAKAAQYFGEVVKRDPSNILAWYYAGISLFKQEYYSEATDYFNKASDNPDLRDNSKCFTGICYLKIGKYSEASKTLMDVKDNTSSDLLRDIAAKWLDFLEKWQKEASPYRLYLKIGYRYDDNVMLKPLDAEGIPGNEDDYLLKAFFSGKYEFFNTKTFDMGAGYSHYQTWHHNLKEYDLTGSLFSVYAKYQLHPLTFGFSYLPSYYWLDSKSYFMSHQFRPEIAWEVDERLFGRLSYSFYEDNHFENYKRDGYTNDLFLDVYYNLFDPAGKKGYLFGGVGYEDKSATQAYGQYKAQAGISLNLPWYLNLGLKGKYYRKKYDASYGTERNDTKYLGSISLSHNFLYDWLDVVAEFNYTKNNSNIRIYDYERNVTSLSVTTDY